jgi:hypothetical protein
MRSPFSSRAYLKANSCDYDELRGKVVPNTIDKEKQIAILLIAIASL